MKTFTTFSAVLMMIGTCCFSAAYTQVKTGADAPPPAAKPPGNVQSDLILHLEDPALNQPGTQSTVAPPSNDKSEYGVDANGDGIIDSAPDADDSHKTGVSESVSPAEKSKTGAGVAPPKTTDVKKNKKTTKNE